MRGTILIPTKFTRASGGLSSLLDLGIALQQIGYDVGYYSDRYVSLLWFFRVCLRQGEKKVSYRQLVRITHSPHHGPLGGKPPASWTRCHKRAKASGIKPEFGAGSHNREALKWMVNAIWDPIEVLLGLLRKDRKKIFEAAIVVTSEANPNLLRSLREVTHAKLLLNHAGSAEAFIDYFAKINQGNGHPEEANLNGYQGAVGEVDFILYQSAQQLSDSRKNFGLPKDKCLLLRPSCDETAALLAKSSTSPFQRSETHIVIVGSLQPRKGQNLAIQALPLILESHPSAQLHLVGAIGTIEFMQQLNELIGSLGLDGNVNIHGHRKDYLNWIAHSDLVMQPSLAEGVSRVLREAIFLKRNIVSFDIPGTREIMSNSIANLARPFDSNDLAAKANALLSDVDIARELAEEHFRNYLTQNSWSAYINAVDDVFSDLLNSRESGPLTRKLY